MTRDAKLAGVDGILSTYLGYSPGCNFGNNWCDAVERQYKDPASGCTCGGGGFPGGMLALLALAMRPRRRRAIAPVVALLFATAGTIALTAGSARAAEPPPAVTTETPVPADKHEPPAPVTVPVAQPGPHDPSEGAWGGYLGLSGSVDKAALAVQLGLRRRVSTHWTLGLDAEWNPWISMYGATTFRAGAFNAYGTVILRFPLAYENFNLRTTLNVGISYLLYDLYGAPKGSTGLYAGISPLGLEWKLSGTFLLIINPLNIALPVPQLKGVPMTYPQYRISIGLGILAG